MQCVALEDPGLVVLPTHRLFRGIPPMTADQLAARLAGLFTMRPAGQGRETGPTVWEDVQTTHGPAALGLFTQTDQRWTIAQLTEAGQAKMAEVAAEHSPAWRALAVSVLHRLVIETLLGQSQAYKPNYAHLVDEVVAELASGQYPLAALVPPATVDDIRATSIQGERMPAKSTYFYPKLLSGLVFNPLE
jgi:hypothetical protein